MISSEAESPELKRNHNRNSSTFFREFMFYSLLYVLGYGFGNGTCGDILSLE